MIHFRQSLTETIISILSQCVYNLFTIYGCFFSLLLFHFSYRRWFLFLSAVWSFDCKIIIIYMHMENVQYFENGNYWKIFRRLSSQFPSLCASNNTHKFSLCFSLAFNTTLVQQNRFSLIKLTCKFIKCWFLLLYWDISIYCTLISTRNTKIKCIFKHLHTHTHREGEN